MTAHLIVLGTAQDAGYPHAGCRRPCCLPAWSDPARRRLPSCLALIDPASGGRWLIDATPAFREQLNRLEAHASGLERQPVAQRPDAIPDAKRSAPLDGILLTHAHIGHYTGLMYLGREAMGATGLPVFAMPRMANFLATQAPWEQLVRLGQIELRPLAADTPMRLGSSAIQVVPRLVPHRGEYSETIAFEIHGPHRRLLYLPDIDRWESAAGLARWLDDVDIAYLDGTFFSADELPGRNAAEVPHPPIAATLALLSSMPADYRRRIRFLHLNHTNPVLYADGPERATLLAAGCGVAEEGETLAL